MHAPGAPRCVLVNDIVPLGARRIEFGFCLAVARFFEDITTWIHITHYHYFLLISNVLEEAKEVVPRSSSTVVCVRYLY